MIHDTNDTFDFINNVNFISPKSTTNGCYFIRCFGINQTPLYIQSPKCKSKQGIVKTGKKMHCDLVFTHDDESFLRWIEEFENQCQQILFKNRSKWFDSELEMHDIENSFASCFKIYKSQHVLRANIPLRLGKCGLKIYNENEMDVDIDTITSDTVLMSILEIQGIKCSSRSFQIDFEIKQMMVLNPIDLFEKCIIAKKNIHSTTQQLNLEDNDNNNDDEIKEHRVNEETVNVETVNVEAVNLEKVNVEAVNLAKVNVEKVNVEAVNLEKVNVEAVNLEKVNVEDINLEEVNLEEEIKKEEEIYLSKKSEEKIKIEEKIEDTTFNLGILKKEDENELCEIDFSIPINQKEEEEEVIHLKKRNDVYFEMYTSAKKKAKMARNYALSAYLEAKRIKNTYLLDEVFEEDEDEDDSDQDFYSGKKEEDDIFKLPNIKNQTI